MNRLVYALLWTVLAGVSATAQINTGRIDGVVQDSSGAVVPSVKILAINQTTNVTTSTQTTATGDFLINFLVPGTYRLVAEKEGFQKTAITGVVVNAGGLARVDFDLKLGQMQQAVEVTANPLAVSAESSELSKTFGSRELQQLPNIDRNPLYQLNLLPGANNGSGSGNYGNNGGENGSAIGLSRAQMASIGGVDANANSVYIEGIFNR